MSGDEGDMNETSGGLGMVDGWMGSEWLKMSWRKIWSFCAV